MSTDEPRESHGGGSPGSVENTFRTMSYFNSDSAFQFPTVTDKWRSLCQLEPATNAGDRAIDAALRGVPLPDGLLTRLGRIVYTISDEAADQVDCLGC